MSDMQLREETKQSSQGEIALERLTRELRVTRIFCGIVTFLLLILLAGSVLVFAKVQKHARELQPMIEKLQPLTEQLAAVDYETLNDTIEKLNTSLDQVDWEELSNQIKALDMEAFNEAMEGLDTTELTKALENLNTAVDKLEEFSDSMGNFLRPFSR